MADTAALKAAAERRTGSSPVPDTLVIRWADEEYESGPRAVGGHRGRRPPRPRPLAERVLARLRRAPERPAAGGRHASAGALDDRRRCGDQDDPAGRPRRRRGRDLLDDAARER